MNQGPSFLALATSSSPQTPPSLTPDSPLPLLAASTRNKPPNNPTSPLHSLLNPPPNTSNQSINSQHSKTQIQVSLQISVNDLLYCVLFVSFSSISHCIPTLDLFFVFIIFDKCSHGIHHAHVAPQLPPQPVPQPVQAQQTAQQILGTVSSNSL